MNIKIAYIILISLTFMVSCAQFGTPQGGPKDEDPPYIIKELSEENYQTNFNKKSFQISFNEWIQLSNPIKEIVISPPCSYPLQVTSRGKTLKVEFNEEEILKENATYQINFGDALKDFTEGNIYKNFVFVFSTGAVIDSLSVSGTVTDALTGDVRSDVLVCLYDILSDSCIIQEKPFYFTKTDKSGRYKLSNIKNDTFQVFTLKDENVNYIYDLSSEQVGFLDELLMLTDSNLINIDLEIFDEKDDARLIDYVQDYKGLFRLDIQPKAELIKFRSESEDSIYSFLDYQSDSLYIWHKDLESDSSRFIITYDATEDTLKNKKAKKSVKSMPLNLDKNIKDKISFHKDDTINISFNKPLAGIDSIQVTLKDSNKIFLVRESFINDKSLGLKISDLKHNSNYELLLLPENIEDVYGTKNQDTIKLELETYDPEQFGNILLNIINETDTAYIVQFMTGNDILNEMTIDSTQKVQLNKLPKGSYKLKIIEDLNKNNKWTSGNVVLKRLPERIKEITLDELKPGWDLDLDIKIKEIFYGTPFE